MRSGKIILALISFLLAGTLVQAELVAVSQLGYHPQASKQVISYTNAGSGTFSVRDQGSGSVVFAGTLQKAKSFDGADVNCQGNNPCLVGDFTSLTTPGTYYVQTSLGGKSPSFPLAANIYQNSTPTLLEFFNALSQQNSAYHADLHSGINPDFTIMADGSFIMEADQATLSLIRSGSAYRRNPSIFQEDKYAVIAPGKADMQEYILQYVRYLSSIQGVSIQQRTDGVGFRLNPNVEVTNAFVPGPTNLTSLTVYIPNSAHTVLKTVPVSSLCGADNGSASWDRCIEDASTFYRCQIDEPCLNSTYIERTGVLLSNTNGYGISRGWGYEFGCFADVQFTNPGFIATPDPCQIFYPETSRKDTVTALLGYLEALPAVNDYSTAEGAALFERARNTYLYVKSNYSAISGTDSDAGFWGASLFLLYDYTNNTAYLTEAYNLRAGMPTSFISDGTRGNEFYWEEYVRHKQQIIAAGLTYSNAGTNPEDYFRGKMYFDYKDAGTNKAMSQNAERIFQYDNNIQFQNSRFMLTEGLLAAKTAQLHPGAESFIPMIADNQLAWLTGMNGVQNGTGLGAPIVSYSFIFGIGDNPNEFHSRLLVDTNFTQLSDGKIIGARGSGYQFYNGSDYIYLDGKFNILNSTLGALGNGYRNETPTQTFVVGQQFANGKKIIPGWINGVFDINTGAETDVIFNYRDDLDTYEFTETTNEMVATALELFAYQDARYNNRPRHVPISFSDTTNFTVSLQSSVVGSNVTLTCTPSSAGAISYQFLFGDGTNSTTTQQSISHSYANGNYTATCIANHMTLPQNASSSTVFAVNINSSSELPNGTCFANLQSLPVTCSGTLISDTFDGCRRIQCSAMTVLACDKPNGNNPQFFEIYRQSGAGAKVCIGSTCIQNEGYVKSGNYPVCIANASPPVSPLNGTLNLSTSPQGSSVQVNGVAQGTSPLLLSLAPGTYAVSATKLGFIAASGSVTIVANQTTATTLMLSEAGAETCYSSVQSIPATCTGGSITTDSFNGCRTIICTNGASSLQVLACDKSGFFEMYRQSEEGSSIQDICIGGTCIAKSGYAKSSNYPICNGGVVNDTAAPIVSGGSPSGTLPSGSTSAVVSVQTNEPSSCRYSGTANSAFSAMTPFSTSGSTTHSSTVSNLANGQPYQYYVKCRDVAGNTNGADYPLSFSVAHFTGITSAEVSIAPWFPQGKSYVFLCNAQGFAASSYDFSFGDGNVNRFRSTNDVYYTYTSNGTYNVSCTATDGVHTAEGSLQVVV